MLVQRCLNWVAPTSTSPAEMVADEHIRQWRRSVQYGLLSGLQLVAFLSPDLFFFFPPPAVSVQAVNLSRQGLLLCVQCWSCCLSWRLWVCCRDKSANGWWGQDGLALPWLIQQAWEAAVEVMALQVDRSQGTKELVFVLAAFRRR